MNSTMMLQDLGNQIASMRKTLESIHLECQQETTRKHQLYQKRFKLEALVRQFENDNEGYLKIRKCVEETVTDVYQIKNHSYSWHYFP